LSGRPRTLGLLLVGITLLHAYALEHPGADPSTDSSSLTTSNRVELPGWWPTKGDAERNLYVGSDVCAECHKPIAKLQETTPMYHAGVRAAQSEILNRQPLEFQEGNLHYALSASPAAVTYSVSDGKGSDTAPVVWAFGAGVIGQTYVLKIDEVYVEGRMSYFTRLGALDITIGHSPRPQADVEKALGHVMEVGVAQRCFSCHTTAAVTANVFEPEQAIPGVRCEACHGPGAKHVAAMKSQQFKRAAATIVNPAHFAPSDAVDFCGACHRTWADVVMQSPTGIGVNAVRFQPYLLENSRCWGKRGDARLTCTACHDPHRPLVHDASAYDAKCLACHATAGETQGLHAAKTVCHSATKQCTSCHMPKYELPQGHASFTDHTIRVARTSPQTTAKPAS
jgi:Cytochrome c554 and c-prime